MEPAGARGTVRSRSSAQPYPPRARLPALLLQVAGAVDRARPDRVAALAQALCAQVPASPAVDRDPLGVPAAAALAEAAVLLHEAAAVGLVKGGRDPDPAQGGAAAGGGPAGGAGGAGAGAPA